MDRYQQQIIVPEIGMEGHKKIGAANVIIVGAGGLGVPLSTYLSASGIGNIGIIDGDVISISNLHRQFSYREEQVGQSKALVLQAVLSEQNPGLQVSAYNENLHSDNAASLIRQYDIICDCSDNVETRILVDRVCGEQNKPLIYASVRDWEGYVTVLHGKKNISLNNIFDIDRLYANAGMNCSVTGIVGSTCGVAATIQANEVIKFVTGIETELDGGILCFDLRLPVFRVLKLNTPH